MAPTKSATLGNVAVIGGCGFLGMNIVELILENYPNSTIAALDVNTKNNRIDSPSVSYYNCDITDLLAVEELFLKLKLDVVIHTAAIVPTQGISNAMTYRVNVDGTKNLITASQNTDVKAFVYTSSSSVIVGNVSDIINADESWPLCFGKDQPEYYSETKALGEVAVIEANRSPQTFLTCSVRPATIYGEGDVLTLFRMLQIRGIKKYFQIGNNDNLFDTTHVKNAAHAHLLAADALLQTHNLPAKPLDTEKVDGEAFMITNGTPVYFWDFVRRVWRERGLPEDKVYSLSWVIVLDSMVALWIATILEFLMGFFGKVPNFNKLAVRSSAMKRYFKIDKARHRLGYEPIVSVEEGIITGVKEVKQRLIKLKML